MTLSRVTCTTCLPGPKRNVAQRPSEVDRSHDDEVPGAQSRAPTIPARDDVAIIHIVQQSG